MMRFWVVLVMGALMLANPCVAEGIDYYPDPVYKSINEQDMHPMTDIVGLAQRGDTRAQFILGDLYAKGKGGMPRDTTKARKWFKESATFGTFESFIRLAALAKRENKPVEAYKWYTLAIRHFPSGAWKRHAEKARSALEKSAKLKNEDLETARKEANVWDAQVKERLEKMKAEKVRKEVNKAKDTKNVKEKSAKNDNVKKPSTKEQEKKNG